MPESLPPITERRISHDPPETLDADRERVRRLLADRAARYRAAELTGKRDDTEYIQFTRGSTHYLVATSSIAEVRSVENVTRFPGISPVIVGVINVRGRIVTVHDLAAFAGRTADMPAVPWVLIGWREISDVALLADDVQGIRAIAAASIREAPVAMSARKECYAGILEDGTVVLTLARLARTPDFYNA